MIDRHSPPLIRVIRAHKRIPGGRIVRLSAPPFCGSPRRTGIHPACAFLEAPKTGECRNSYLRLCLRFWLPSRASDTRNAPNRDFTRAAPEMSEGNLVCTEEEKRRFYSAPVRIRHTFEFSYARWRTRKIIWKKNYSHTSDNSFVYLIPVGFDLERLATSYFTLWWKLNKSVLNLRGKDYLETDR